MNYEEDDDSEEHLAEQRAYMWNRKVAIFNEVEDLWLSYLEELDYPKVDFIDYVARNYYRAKDREGARYLIWVWKFVKSFMPRELN